MTSTTIAPLKAASRWFLIFPTINLFSVCKRVQFAASGAWLQVGYGKQVIGVPPNSSLINHLPKFHTLVMHMQGIDGILMAELALDSGDVFRSYTEQEYDTAVDLNLPRLMFIAPDDFPLPARLRESEDYWKRQQSFRARMRASTCPGLQRVLVTAFLAICGGLYKLKYDNGSKDLDTYKDSETFRLPELLSQLGAVSNQFRTFACLSAAGRTSRSYY
jgi:hypothetical protein